VEERRLSRKVPEIDLDQKQHALVFFLADHSFSIVDAYTR
jgi:hypothetical protein